MKNRKWTGAQKLQIVMEGLQGKRPIGDICLHYEITQGQYYKWRDPFLKNAPKAFESSSDKKTERLEAKVKQLTSYVGELTVELKKTEDELRWLES